MKRIKIAFLVVALMCIAMLAVFSGCVEKPQKHECPVCHVCEDCDRAASFAKQEGWRAVTNSIMEAAQAYYDASQQAGDRNVCGQHYDHYLALTSLMVNLWVQCQVEGSAGCKASKKDLVALLTADLKPAPDQPGDQPPEEELGEPAEYEPTGGPPRAAQ